MKVSEVDLKSLKTYPKNPRKGNVDIIATSLSAFGQYKPITVNQRTNEILAGNHTYQAAKQLGWSTISVTYVDVDEETAKRIVLIDNRSNDMASYDAEALLDLLAELPDLEATGYDDVNLDDLLASIEETEKEEVSDEKFLAEAQAELEEQQANNKEDEEPIERGALLKLADLGWDEPKTETHQGQHWTLGRHHLFIVDLNRDHAAFSPFMVEGTIFAPYPNPHVTSTLTARETPLVMVQPRPILAAHIIDKFKAVFPDQPVKLVP